MDSQRQEKSETFKKGSFTWSTEVGRGSCCR